MRDIDGLIAQTNGLQGPPAMSRKAKPTQTTKSLKLGKIHQGDCIKLMKKIDDGSIDLVFADPPFNIGYEYDEYDDRQDDEKYLAWCEQWIAEVHRILKPNGTFWLAIGDEYAAELKVAAGRNIGFYTRSWVIWYYTFGVNCKNKFSRSHAHLFHFVKNEKQFTFNADDPAIRVPSARALVYGDKRANPKGRLPDDTWILRPQDFQSDAYGFTPEQDTWFFSRVAGTFKERQGFHGCQMPEQLLGRIIRVSSNEGDVVFDPFVGSGTTLAVAKKLGRNFLGTELSTDYQKYATKRLKKIKTGNELDGPSDPVASAPSTSSGVRLTSVGTRTKTQKGDVPKFQQNYGKRPKASNFSEAIEDAFLSTHEGFSSDRLLVDPHLNAAFLDRCVKLGVPGKAAEINRMMLRLRKSGKFKTKFSSRVVPVVKTELDRYSFAAEIAWKLTRAQFSDASLDEILCDPEKAKLFDSIAHDFAPGYKSVDYRWAALRLRKQITHPVRKKAKANFSSYAVERFRPAKAIDDLDLARLDEQSGLYLLKDESRDDLYLGATSNLQNRLLFHKESWQHTQVPTHVSIFPLQAARLKQSKLCTVDKRRPQLNLNQVLVKS